MESARKRRGGRSKKWSETMSPEAQLAMQLAIEDTKAMKLEEASRADSRPPPEVANRSPTRVAFADPSVKDGGRQPETSREPSFTELYERNGSARMRHDVTDESFNEELERKRALGGGKVESAMEIVEIVNHDGDQGALDDQAIDELAKINSVDKCAVWIEATQGHQSEPLPNIAEAEHESRDAQS